MPGSSRYKSLKQSKHSSKDHSNSEDDLRKMKERSKKDENSSRVHGEEASYEKRKTSFQIREGREKKVASLHLNDELLEESSSSKRSKGKVDSFVDGDRWNGGGDVKDTSDRAFDKELDMGNIMKVDEKHRDKSGKVESLKLEHKNKSKRNECRFTNDRIEESSTPIVVEKEGKNRSVSKRKSDKDSSAFKDGRDSKDKDRRLDKERNGDYGSKSGDSGIKVMDWDSGKKQSGDAGEERESKRLRDNTEKEYEKRVRRKKEGSSEIEKHPYDYQEGDERHGPIKSDLLKGEKHRNVKYKDKVYTERSLEDNHKSSTIRMDESYPEESDKNHRDYDEKYREDGEKYAKRQDYRHREDADRGIRRKDEKRREDVECHSKQRDEKSRQVPEDRRDGKYHEDADRNNRHKDNQYHENGHKNVKCVDDRYLKDGDCDDNHRSDGGEGECRHKDEKYTDSEKDLRKNAHLGDEIDREKRQRESKYDRGFMDHAGDRSDKRTGDEIYPADGHARKSSTYDESPNHDYRTHSHKDDQNRSRANGKESCGEGKSQNTIDQRSDPGKRSSKMDSASNRMRTASRNVDAGYSSHSKRRVSPSSSSHYRSLKQNESNYRDYNDERPRENLASSREHLGILEISEKTASRSLENLVSNDYSQLPEHSSERHLKSDIHSSPLQRTSGSLDQKGPRGGKELGLYRLQVNDDASSIFSPSMNKNHLSGSLRSFTPPSFRNSNSPGSAEDGGRSNSHSHHRRIGDSSIGRIQGNFWRGVPTWPSSMPNGLLPFPHAPPPVGFHPSMQSFPGPHIFGVRPSSELNLHSLYGPGHPIGWQNQLNDTCPSLQPWDSNVAAYGDESRNMAVGLDWEFTDDAKRLNNSPRDGDNQSVKPYRSDQTLRDQHEDSSTDIRLSIKSIEINDALVPPNNGFSKDGKTETLCLCQAYLSRLEISVDLADPELFSNFTNFIISDQITDESKMIYVEDVEAKMSTINPPSSTFLPTIDDSVFQRSISLYNKLKQPKDIARSEAFIESGPKSNVYESHDGVPNFLQEPNPKGSSPIDESVARKTEETASSLADETPVDNSKQSSSSLAQVSTLADETPMEIEVKKHPSSLIGIRSEFMAGTKYNEVKNGMNEASSSVALVFDSDNDVKKHSISPRTSSGGVIAGSLPYTADESTSGTENNEMKKGINEASSSEYNDVKKHPFSPITGSGEFIADSAPYTADESTSGTVENNEMKKGINEGSTSESNDVKKHPISPRASSSGYNSALTPYTADESKTGTENNEMKKGINEASSSEYNDV